MHDPDSQVLRRLLGNESCHGNLFSWANGIGTWSLHAAICAGRQAQLCEKNRTGNSDRPELNGELTRNLQNDTIMGWAWAKGYASSLQNSTWNSTLLEVGLRSVVFDGDV